MLRLLVARWEMKSILDCRNRIEVWVLHSKGDGQPLLTWGRFPPTGAWSEYAACPEEYVSLKPASLSFVESASIPLAAMTALQALRKYEGDLAGKTVFVPAGCKRFSVRSLYIRFPNVSSEWNRLLCLPIGQTCLQSRQGDHDGLVFKDSASQGAFGRDHR